MVATDIPGMGLAQGLLGSECMTREVLGQMSREPIIARPFVRKLA